MATEYKLSYTAAQIDEKLGKVDTLEDQIANLGSGTGGSSEAIIDVLALPETDIQEGACYRLYEPLLIYNGWDSGAAYAVDGLPTTGENVVDANNNIVAYYNIQDGVAYCYIDSTTASSLGATAGWYDLVTAAPLAGKAYGGVVTDRSEGTEKDTYYLLVDHYTLYMYQGGEWARIEIAAFSGSGGNSVVIGHYTNKATSASAFAQGMRTTASGTNSHAEGYETTASGYAAHSEGKNTTASGDYAHSEGQSTTASGEASHAEGYQTTASGGYSHAEGWLSTAGNYAHAEGMGTKANGWVSHAEGIGTIAAGGVQHVEGTYNIEDTIENDSDKGVYLHIAGNGNSDTPSNAHTLDWEGNAWFAGDVYTGSTSGTNKDAGSKKLATEEFVTNAVANAGGSGTGTSVTVDSILSSTSTNPVQNKVVTEKFNELSSEIENMVANGGSKTLVGEITMDSTTITASDTTGIYNLNSELQTIMKSVCSKLDEGFDFLYAVITVADMTMVLQCNYLSGSDALNAYRGVSTTISSLAHSSEISQYDFLESYFRTNYTSMADAVLAGSVTVNVKFYTVSAGGGSSTQADWNQNDETAADYIKNRPFYKDMTTVFDQDVTTAQDDYGIIVSNHPSAIVDLNTVQQGDTFEVIFDGTLYSLEIRNVDMPCLGNFYMYCEQSAADQGVTTEEFIDMMAGYMPEIVELAVDTGEPFLIIFDSESTSFVTKEAGTYHFTVNGVAIHKFDSSFINWVEGSAPSSLPEVTTDDNDKVLMVVDGKWVAGSIANGDEVAY